MKGLVKMLTVKQIAQDLSVSERTVHRWITKGILPAIKIENTLRVKEEDYKKFIEGSKK